MWILVVPSATLSIDESNLSQLRNGCLGVNWASPFSGVSCKCLVTAWTSISLEDNVGDEFSSNKVFKKIMQRSRSGVLNSSILPSEVWSEIFYWATYNPAREYGNFLGIKPFDSIEAVDDNTLIEDSFRVKRCISMVCWRWKNLISKYLYEDIRVRHGSLALAQTLERSKETTSGGGIGLYVKRVMIPVVLDRGPWMDAIGKNTRRILECCQNLLVFCRFHPFMVKMNADDFHASVVRIDDLELQKIRRVDWDNSPITAWWPVVPMPKFVWKLQELEILSIGGDNFPWMPNDLEDTSLVDVVLPKVHTLRVRSFLRHGLPGLKLAQLNLPSLNRLILERCPDNFNMTATRFPDTFAGSKITTLEFGRDIRFMWADCLAEMLVYCPNVERLYFPVFSVKVMREDVSRETVFPKLKFVAFHSTIMSPFLYDETRAWTQLYGHVEAFCGNSAPFPNLRDVELCGKDWDQFVNDDRFELVTQVITGSSEDLTLHRYGQILARSESLTE